VVQEGSSIVGRLVPEGSLCEQPLPDFDASLHLRDGLIEIQPDGGSKVEREMKRARRDPLLLQYRHQEPDLY
jgi:hypothetical protein